MSENLVLAERIRVTVWELNADGVFVPRPHHVVDLITNVGRSWLAGRIGGDIGSPMTHVAIGTATSAPALGDTALPGEIDRKAAAVASATDNNLFTASATWGGHVDSVASIAITEAGLLNHANSGSGILFQRVTFSAVTLNNSSFLELTLETRVGSNTI